MSLSDAFWLAAAFAVLCAYYIGEKISDSRYRFLVFPREKPEKGEIQKASGEARHAACGYGASKEHPERV